MVIGVVWLALMAAPRRDVGAAAGVAPGPQLAPPSATDRQPRTR